MFDIGVYLTSIAITALIAGYYGVRSGQRISSTKIVERRHFIIYPKSVESQPYKVPAPSAN